MGGWVAAAQALVRSSLACVAEALSGGWTGRHVLERLEGAQHEASFLAWLSSLCSFLVVLPGSPEPKKGPFYLIKVPTIPASISSGTDYELPHKREIAPITPKCSRNY